jgi:hypothetical protein
MFESTLTEWSPAYAETIARDHSCTSYNARVVFAPGASSLRVAQHARPMTVKRPPEQKGRR